MISISVPFFSIGVTTYNKPDLLKQTLTSITSQTFSDFEVIVGNDYIQKNISGDLLGIEDSRIRFVNHSKNLGEIGNMNSLLEMGNGRYFTWLADDDLYNPNFLKKLHIALVKFNYPLCAFSSYKVIRGTSFSSEVNLSGQEQLLSGREFLRMCLKGKLKTIGCYGVFDTRHIRSIGGIERLSDSPFALYSEYLLLVRAGLLRYVVYVNIPLVLYREHEASWGNTNTDVAQYKQAGRNLVRECIKVFMMPELSVDFYKNLLSILKLTLHVFVCKLAARDGRIDRRETIMHLLSLKEQFNSLEGSFLYWASLVSLVHASLWLTWPVAKLTFKLKVPFRFVKLVRTILFSCHAVRKYFK